MMDFVQHLHLLLLLLFITDANGNSMQVLKDKFRPSVDQNLPQCMRAEEMPKYHTAGNVCQRDLQNSIQHKQIRATRYHQLLEDGAYHIPDEQTAYCPKVAENWEISDFGHNTRFIFDNAASTPVVLVFFSQGIEYSAIVPTITPPHHDSRAIVQPGEWAVISAFEGHVFRARELKDNGEMGRILVQHQPGLIPIKNRYGHNLDCEKQQVDLEPVVGVEVGEGKIRNLRGGAYDLGCYDHCNIIHKGFRNTLSGCSVNMFNVGEENPLDGPMQCKEEFQFHLGLSPCPDDYMISKESRIKFSPTYIGETLVARLESNPDVIVDSYTVQPVHIRDCPTVAQDLPDIINTTAVALSTDKYNQGGLNRLRASVHNYS